MGEPVSIRFNNPGALNTAAWVRRMPGFLSELETTPGNSTARFATPEQGVAAWWELLRRYRDLGKTTVGQIVTQYGGGQDYSEYAAFVEKRSGLPLSSPVSLDNDRQLITLGRAMFWYEAGKARSDLSDAQLIKGFNLGRKQASGVATGASNAPGGSEGTGQGGGLLGVVLRVLAALFRRK